jgi:Flp pilus assembly protein TadB
VRHPREDQPALITDAPASLDDEYDRRRKRYAIMMAVRALCVIAAAMTYRVSWLLAVVFVVGGAVLPWCAVLLANDGPPKRARRFRRYGGPPGERALPAGDDERTIDG